MFCHGVLDSFVARLDCTSAQVKNMTIEQLQALTFMSAYFIVMILGPIVFIVGHIRAERAKAKREKEQKDYWCEWHKSFLP